MTDISSPFTQAVLDTERHVARFGWDQPVRLFALVETSHLLAREPQLAAELSGGDPSGAAAFYTSLEQEDLPAQDVESLLAQLAWPEGVAGAVLAVERIVVPPEAEAGLPEDAEEAARLLMDHPDREDVRVIAAVTRDGERVCLLRQRAHDADDQVALGPDLAPGLLDALAATFLD